MGTLVQLVVVGFSVWVATSLVPGLDFAGSGWALAGIAIVVAVANVLVKPLLTVVSLPLILGTLRASSTSSSTGRFSALSCGSPARRSSTSASRATRGGRHFSAPSS